MVMWQWGRCGGGGGGGARELAVFREYKLFLMSIGWNEFSSRVQNCGFVSCDDVVFLPQAEVATFRSRWIWLRMPDYSPCYCIGSAFILQRPDVFAELSLMSFFFVFEAGFVSCVSGFERGGCESDVGFLIARGRYFGFIHDVLGCAFSR